MDKFVIASTGVSMNYMPHYIAKEQGFFKEVDLDVTTNVPIPWTNALDQIDSGAAHVVEGGMWVPIIYYNRVKEYKTFAKLSSRCPLVLVSRQPVGTFDWKMLEAKKVLIAGGDGASHGLFILGCAQEAGVDMNKVTVINNFTASMLLKLFLGGFGDIIAMQPDMAAKLAKEEKGYIMADLTVHGGNCPWSVYYGTPEFLANSNNLAGRFTYALQKATDLLLAKDASEFGDIIQKYWPTVDLSYGVDMINLFRKEGMWSESVQVDRAIIDRWQKFIVYGHLIDQPIAHEAIVDDKPYEYAANMSRK